MTNAAFSGHRARLMFAAPLLHLAVHAARFTAGDSDLEGPRGPLLADDGGQGRSRRRHKASSILANI